MPSTVRTASRGEIAKIMITLVSNVAAGAVALVDGRFRREGDGAGGRHG